MHATTTKETVDAKKDNRAEGRYSLEHPAFDKLMEERPVLAHSADRKSGLAPAGTRD
jgi:hypothetical protein